MSDDSDDIPRIESFETSPEYINYDDIENDFSIQELIDTDSNSEAEDDVETSVEDSNGEPSWPSDEDDDSSGCQERYVDRKMCLDRDRYSASPLGDDVTIDSGVVDAATPESTPSIKRHLHPRDAKFLLNSMNNATASSVSDETDSSNHPATCDDSGDELHQPRTQNNMSWQNKVAICRSSSSNLFFVIFSVLVAILSVLKDVTAYWVSRSYDSLMAPTRRARLKSYYKHLLITASDYLMWKEAAAKLDELNGTDAWKCDPTSVHFDYELLIDRKTQLDKVRKSRDRKAMMFLLRTSLSRNLGDMISPSLYTHSHIGTKNIIPEFVNSVTAVLHDLADAPIDEREKKLFFLDIQRSFGRTALLLSGGATFGLSHIGVVKALHTLNLLPRIISGSSAGSIIAAAVCSRTDDEIVAMSDPATLNLDVFERGSEKGNSWLRMLRLIRHGVLFDVEVFREAIKSNIGDLTFLDAFNRTRRILNITVSSSAEYEMPRLLNYLTAPNVLIWSAVAASCAVPFVYKSAPLMAKDKSGKVVPWNPSGHRWIDGSVENDLPMARLSEMFNVNHFIVAQVNPHVVPFLYASSIPMHASFKFILSKVGMLVRSELQHRLNQIIDLGFPSRFPSKILSIFNQKYVGDITIVPSIGILDYCQIVANPNVDVVRDSIIRGEKATWPKVEIIKNHCKIELCIDKVLYRLRSRKFDTVARPPGTFDSSDTQGNNLVKGTVASEMDIYNGGSGAAGVARGRTINTYLSRSFTDARARKHRSQDRGRSQTVKDLHLK